MRRLPLPAALLFAFFLLAVAPAGAATTAQIDAAGTLRITGDASANRISITGDPTGPAVLVDVGEDGTTDFRFDRSQFNAIVLAGGAGDDELRVDNALALFIDAPVTLDGGDGNDRLIGGSGAETLLGGAGNDVVDGNLGADVAQLGSGNDTFRWDPGDGSDSVDGQTGADALDFNGSNAAERIDLTPNGAGVRLSRDVAGITMDLAGLERIGLRTIGSADAVTVGDLTGTATKAVDVDLSANGGGGDGSPDVVTALGTDGADHVGVGSSGGKVVVSGLAAQLSVAGGEATGDSVEVDTLGGNDVVTGGVTLIGPPVTVDGGADADTVTYSGTAAADSIGIARTGPDLVGAFTPAGALVNIRAVENLVVQGLSGNDDIAGQDGIGGLTHLTLDGGAGDDHLQGGDGDDTLLGGTGNDLVDGNRGADTAQLGSGNDHFQWDPGDGSDTIEGQDGADQVDFNGSNADEAVDVSANGPRVRLVRNVGGISMDFAGIERLAVNPRGGADGVTIGSLGGTVLRAVAADLSADGAADTVTAVGTPGNDVVTVAPDVGGIIDPVVDLGAGQA